MHSFFRRRSAAIFAAVCIALTTTVYAQNSPGPQPVPLPPPIVAPADTPYPGTISLLVDVTNITDRVLNVHETIPIKGRDITLLYPEWLPGTHSPSNPVGELAGLVVTANGKRIPWVRDRVDMYAFHVEAPQDATTLDINFQYPGPAGSKTRPYFLEVRRRYLEQRASLSGGILLAGYQIRSCAPFAGGMEIRLLSGREIAERQPGSVQRNDAEYAGRFAALCGRQLQAFRPLHWAGQSGVPRCLRRQTCRSRNHSGRTAIPQEPGDRGAEAFQFASLRSL